MIKTNKLLTIAIPTYNRCAILDHSLCIIKPQIELFKEDIEFIISDNCSTDNTQETVRRYIDEGMPIRYIRNDTNIGASRNIFQCWRIANGKYVWVLGDDDYLAKNTLEFIINILHNDKDYGLLFQPLNPQKKTGYVICNDKESVCAAIDPLMGWISANIIQKRYVDVFDFDEYKTGENIWAWNTSAILNWTAIAKADHNVIICERLFSTTAVDARSSEKFNCFKETVNDIATMNAYRKQLKVGYKYYKRYKHIMFHSIIMHYIENVLFKKHDINLVSENAWGYILKYFWTEPYFYMRLFISTIKYKIPFFYKLKKKLLFIKNPQQWFSQRMKELSNPLFIDQERWRAINPHNDTIQTSKFKHDNVFVGSETTGNLFIYDDINSGAMLRIGDNCFIGDNVHFLLGSDALCAAGFDGDIIIQNNVVFGINVIVYPGVTIEHGATILPNSVIMNDIPANSTVQGNPGRIEKQNA